MKKIVSVIFIISLIFISGCKDEQDLGGNYYFLPKYEAIDVGYPDCEAIIYKSFQKYYYKDIKVKGDVTEVNHNSKFIIAIQKPLIPCINTRKENNTVNTLRYYIINKHTDKVYGPFNKEDYIQKRNKLGVPEYLKLKNLKN